MALRVAAPAYPAAARRSRWARAPPGRAWPRPVPAAGPPSARLGGQTVDQRVVGEPGEREVQMDAPPPPPGPRTRRPPGRPGAAGCARNRSRAASCSVCLASVTSWNSQPTPSGTGSSRERRGQPHETAAPAAPPLALRRSAQRHPQLGGRRRRALGEHMLQRALQLLHALGEQLAQRAAQQRPYGPRRAPAPRAR